MTAAVTVPGEPRPLPSIDVVIPVHTAERPIARAVRSVLSAHNPKVRALVVCHNIDAVRIAKNLHGLHDPRLELIEYRDQIPSPAGPLNAGVRAASSDYVTFLGSDDEFGSGSLDAWSIELHGQQLHIGQLLADGEGRVFAPAPRIGRFEQLNAAKDLLNYRTAPVGALISRELISRPESPGFTEGFRTGEDITLGAYLWNRAESITYSRFHDGYRIREDGSDRVSTELPALAVLTAPIDTLLAQLWITQLDVRATTALGVKLIRNHLLESCRALAQSGKLSAADLAQANRVLNVLLQFAPRALGYMPRQDAIPARLLMRGKLADFAQRMAAPGQGSLWNRVVPGNPLRVCSAESIIRRVIRYRSISRSLKPLEKITAS